MGDFLHKYNSTLSRSFDGFPFVFLYLGRLPDLDFPSLHSDPWKMENSNDPGSHPSPVPPKPSGPDARQWITLLHLSALAGLVIVGFGHILGPILIWLLKKNDVPGMDAAGREVLNYQISWSLWFFICGMIAFLGSCLIVPIALPVLLVIFWAVFLIKGAICASNGENYRFPLTIRFL